MSSSCYFPAKSVEQMTVEQLFVCTQKMKLLKKPVKPIRAISFFVSSSWFAAKSVEQLLVEQSQFKQFTMSPNVHNNLQFYTKIVFWLSFRRANNEKNAANVQHQESILLCGYSMELFGNSQKYLCSLRYNILISFLGSFFMHNG